MKRTVFIYLPLLLATSACQDPSFSVKGEIEGGDGKTVILEKADHAGVWVALDSARLKSDGKFKFNPPAPAAPEIYRLDLDGRYVYFPVDSIESISISAPASDFAGAFILSGSENAENLARFEKELLAKSATLSMPDSAASFKRRVYTEYLQNAKGSVVSYYILTKTIDGKPLFSPDADARYFAAVATAFRQFRPDDPRCALLEKTATEGLRKIAGEKGQKRVLQAEAIGYFPISLPDEKGNETALSSIAGHGTPTLLLFSDLSDPDAMALNSSLRELYESGKIKIYNVGLDSDRLTWCNAARNLPWTTVHANVTAADEICGKYRVATLPTFFLIDSNGDLSGRASNIEEFKKLL